MSTMKEYKSAVYVSVILIAFSLFGCTSTRNLSDPHATRIVMHRYGCEGTCPVYTLIMDGAGAASITFEPMETYWIDSTEQHAHFYQVPKDSVNLLLAEFEKIHFFDLLDTYPEYNEDFPSVAIWLRMDGREKRVMHPEWSVNAMRTLTDSVLVRQMNELDTLAYRIDIASRDSALVADHQKLRFKR
jgi:hypothetical protein